MELNVMSNKDLLDFEKAMRREIALLTGDISPKPVAPTATKKAKKKEGREVILGISNNRGHTVTEFSFISKHMFELPAEMEARRKAKELGLTTHSTISNTKLK